MLRQIGQSHGESSRAARSKPPRKANLPAVHAQMCPNQRSQANIRSAGSSSRAWNRAVTWPYSSRALKCRVRTGTGEVNRHAGGEKPLGAYGPRARGMAGPERLFTRRKEARVALWNCIAGTPRRFSIFLQILRKAALNRSHRDAISCARNKRHGRCRLLRKRRRLRRGSESHYDLQSASNGDRRTSRSRRAAVHIRPGLGNKNASLRMHSRTSSPFQSL